MTKRLPLFFLGTFVLFLFVFFSYLVHKDLFTQLDFNTTVKIQDKVSRVFDQPFSSLSFIGSFEIATIVLLLLLAIRRKLMGILALFFYGVFHLIEIFGKSFVDHAPPPEFMVRTEKLVEFPQFHVRAEFSYPSGHAGRAVFLSFVLGLFIWKSKKIPMHIKFLLLAVIGGYDLIMFVSRIYLGEHWLSDVLGGALLGIAMALLSEVAFSF